MNGTNQTNSNALFSFYARVHFMHVLVMCSEMCTYWQLLEMRLFQNKRSEIHNESDDNDDESWMNGFLVKFWSK